jgi:RNA ligase
VDIADLFDPSLLEAHLEQGLVASRRHPFLPLSVYNYTPAAQYSQAWDPVTLACRGLIVDDDGQVVARPLEKFFNHDEHVHTVGALPDGDFTVWDKLDGSLLIATRYAGQLVCATRGSFLSEQAAAGRTLLEAYDTAGIVEGTTFLFEVLHPVSRVVVHYPFDDVVLLSVRDTASGAETLPDDARLDHLPFRRAKRIDAASLDELVEVAATESSASREGFVVRFDDGTRVKVKLDEYCRLHKLLTGVTPRRVWELLAAGDDLSALVERVPDEFHRWLTDTADELRARHAAIVAEVDETFAQVAEQVGTGDRKRFAAKVTCEHRELAPLLFARLDGRDITDAVFKRIRPAGDEVTFWNGD